MAWELINSDPFKNMEKARSEMDRLLDTFLFGKPKINEVVGEEEWQPPIDVAETETELVVTVEIPGVDPNEIDVSLSGDTLFIRGEKRPETEEKGEDYHLLERNYGAFVRSVLLPAEVQRDKISASYKNGALTITLPKSVEAQKKEFKIKVE